MTELLFIFISIAILLYIISHLATRTKMRHKEEVLERWRDKYRSDDYQSPIINNVPDKSTGNDELEENNVSQEDPPEDVDDDPSDDFEDDDYDDDDELLDGDFLDDDDDIDEDDYMDDEKDDDDDVVSFGMSFPFDSNYDYDANDPSYYDEYSTGYDDEDEKTISEDREFMHLGYSSFYSDRANEEIVKWKDGYYYPKSAIHEMPPTYYKYLDDDATPYKVPVKRKKKKK